MVQVAYEVRVGSRYRVVQVAYEVRVGSRYRWVGWYRWPIK